MRCANARGGRDGGENERREAFSLLPRDLTVLTYNFLRISFPFDIVLDAAQMDTSRSDPAADPR